MLARFRVLLPYYFIISYQANLLPYEFEHESYKVKIYPPRQANADSSVMDVYSPEPVFSVIKNLDEPKIIRTNSEVKLDNSETVKTNLIQIDLWADRDFKRDILNEEGVSNVICDPPIELLTDLVNTYIGKLRTVGRIVSAKSINQTNAGWKLEYLNDDESKLEKDLSKGRILSLSKISFKLPGVTKYIWDKSKNLPHNYLPPVWDTLLLDAKDLLPEVNASIVIVNAALEAFINWMLNTSNNKSELLEDSFREEKIKSKKISIKDKFDQELHAVYGHSLKEKPELWDAFEELRDARNSMVHTGSAIIKKKENKKIELSVNFEMAKRMISNAERIIAWVEKLLPEDKRRPIIKEKINYQIAKNFTGDEDDESFLLGIKSDTNGFLKIS